MKIEKYAAIDIGSNAVRLLISNIIEEEEETTKFKKSSLVRVPIRLGADAFVAGHISDENISRMVDAMKAFKLLMNVHGVKKYKACATSAMREATNGKEVVSIIKKEAEIDIDIIDGKKEAAIISSTDLKSLIRSNNSYLYVDVGGGSTEFTLFTDGEITASKSFKLGTVRLLSNKKSITKQTFNDIEEWIKKHTKNIDKISLIGSGGNINKIFKISGRETGKALSYVYINAQYQFMKKMSYEDRIREMDLNADRADVILPATKIYLSAMKWSGARKIFVPKIGLADGIIKSLYFNKIE